MAMYGICPTRYIQSGRTRELLQFLRQGHQLPTNGENPVNVICDMDLRQIPRNDVELLPALLRQLEPGREWGQIEEMFLLNVQRRFGISLNFEGEAEPRLATVPPIRSRPPRIPKPRRDPDHPEHPLAATIRAIRLPDDLCFTDALKAQALLISIPIKSIEGDPDLLCLFARSCARVGYLLKGYDEIVEEAFTAFGHGRAASRRLLEHHHAKLEIEQKGGMTVITYNNETVRLPVGDTPPEIRERYGLRILDREGRMA